MIVEQNNSRFTGNGSLCGFVRHASKTAELQMFLLFCLKRVSVFFKIV